MSRLMLSATLALGLAAAAGTVLAQAPAAPAAPAGPVINQDPASAIAGTYKLDANHASVIARVTHGGGASVSTVRFGVKEGSLVWNPANVEASKLNVVVDMTPRFDPITYGQDLKGPNFLDLAQFPTATFVSTSVAKTGATTGTITGNLTFRGQTKPVTITASLVGAGKTGRGIPVVGFAGVMKFKRSDFGFTFQAANIGNDVEVHVDGEFTIPPPPAPPAA
jgi:polyisoprenoid-binding protein YceI